MIRNEPQALPPVPSPPHHPRPRGAARLPPVLLNVSAVPSQESPLTGQLRGRAGVQAASRGHVPAGARRRGGGSVGATGRPRRGKRACGRCGAGGLCGAARPGMLGRLRAGPGRSGAAPEPPRRGLRRKWLRERHPGHGGAGRRPGGVIDCACAARRRCAWALFPPFPVREVARERGAAQLVLNLRLISKERGLRQWECVLQELHRVLAFISVCTPS